MDEFNTTKDDISTPKPEFLLVQLNGRTDKKEASTFIKVKLSSTTNTVEELIQEDIVRKHMSKGKKSYPGAKLYSKNGVELTADDIFYLKTGDTVYMARYGEKFEYQQVMDRYEKLSLLGAGGFGKVYLMRDKEKENDQMYAVKFINMSEYLQKADGIYEIEREAKTLKMLNSKFIVQLENYFILNKDVVLVMEYAQGGELKQYLAEKGGKLQEYEVQLLMKQIITGLSSCHQKGIIHRDLKLENVLFMDKEHRFIKIVDFGIAGFCLNNLKEKTDAGTFKYMAPEVLSGEINLANPMMDIWALGVMMFIMIYGFHPFVKKQERFSKDYDLKNLIARIVSEPLDIPQPSFNKDAQDQITLNESSPLQEIPIITESCKNLISQLLNKNPKERIQLIDVQFHPWFELTEDEMLKNKIEVEEQMLKDYLEKEEKSKLKFMNSITKRSTLSYAQSNGLLKPFQQKTPKGSNNQMINGRRQGALTPVELAKMSKEEIKEDRIRGLQKKRISQFEIEDNLKQNPISPLMHKQHNNKIGGIIHNYHKK